MNIQDDDFDDIESILAADAAPANPKPKRGDFGLADSDFSELDDLLSESLTAIAETAAIKSARKRIQDHRLSGAELEEVQSTIKRWELSREWLPSANVAMFEAQVCTCCGSSSLHFKGYFQRQTGRISKAERWVAVDSDKQSPNLPKERKIMETSSPTCPACASLAGYPL